MEHHVPTSISASISHLPKFAVQYFSFLDNVKALCRNANIMENSVRRYDSESDVYGEINTWAWWMNAETELFEILETCGIHNTSNHYICPVILFIDGTFCDRNGRLNTEPVLCSIGKISLHNRKQPWLWFFQGLLPMK